MYTLSLEVVNKCNLNCSYCYLGEKKNTSMSIDTAKKAIEIAVHEVQKQYDKTLVIYFIGGEPLIAFNVIYEIVAYTKSRCMEMNLKYMFSITTNGTLLTKKIIDFFIKDKFEIKLSLDGSQEVHDLNRKDYQNVGSFLTIINKLKLLRKYEKESDKKVSYAHVVTKNNYQHFEKNFQFLIDLGAERVETGIDYYCTWNNDEMKGLGIQIVNVFALYKNQVQIEKKRIYWNLLEHYLEMYLTTCNFYACKAGLNSMFVAVNGKIYTCIELPEFQIGSIMEGLNIQRIREIAYVEDKLSESCINCKYKSICKTRGCQASNYEIHRNIYEPVEVKCRMTKVFLNLIENNFTSQQLENLKIREDR